MRNIVVTKTISVIISLLFLVVLLLTSIQVVVFNTNFYDKEYIKLDRAQEIGISHSELMMVTQHILNYVSDKNDSLQISANIQGVKRSVFSEREIKHMVDVKNLYNKAIKIRNLFFYTVLLLLIIMFCLDKRNLQKNIVKGYIISLIITVFCFAVIITFALIDFDKFWDSFHYLVFDNDLWLLDPSEDFLINMVPLKFFYDMVFRIIFVFCSSLAAITLLYNSISKIAYKKPYTKANVDKSKQK